MAEINLDSGDGLTGDVETNQVDTEMEDQVKLPQIGQTFTDIEEMFLYYKDYAKITGFPVLRRSSKKGENGELKYVTFTCARTGKFKSKSSNPLKPRPSTKTGCQARLGGCLDDDGKWKVSSLNLEHNHSLSPSKSRFFRCFRKISASVKRRLEINDMVDGIITDQDKAIKNAIKIHEKLGIYKKYEQMSFCLQGVIYDSQSPVEFEENWMMVIEKYSLGENEWLDGLFKERHYWVPCFVKDSFWAGMSTTQRSEGVNAFFDGFVHSKTSLKQFVEQYSNALASKFEKERQADSDSSNKLVLCVTKFEIEKQAQQVYTIIKFQEFQKELTGKMYCDFLSCKDEGGISITDIQEDVEVGKGLKRVTFTVSFNKWKCEVKCSCRNFEFRGILCRHALTVLLRNNVVKILEKYILRIWRKDVKRCHTRVNICYNARETTLE